MLRFVVLTTLVALASAYGGSYGGSYGGNYGGSLKSFGGLTAGGYGGYAGGYQAGGYSGGLIPAAIQSRRSVQFYDVPTQYAAPAPLSIDVPAHQQPINFLFRSSSSPLNLETAHEATSGSYQENASQDEPHVRVHTVTRPVIQKVNEIISPYRQIQQQVQPVQEEVQALVARGQYVQPQLVQKPLLQKTGYGYGGSSYQAAKADY